MATLEISYPTTSRPGYLKIAQAKENDHKFTLIIEAFEEKINKHLKEMQKNSM